VNELGWLTYLTDWYEELSNSPQTTMWAVIILLAVLVTGLFMRSLCQQRNLKMSEQRRDELLSMLEIFPEPVAILKESFEMVYGNQRLTNLVGWSRKELQKLKHRDYTPDKYAADDEAEAKKYAMSGKLGPYKKHFLTRDGARVLVELRGQKVMYQGKPHILAEIRGVESLKFKNMQEADRQQKEVIDRQFDFVSNLAGGVAHDLNNTLGPLIAYPDMMLERLSEESDLRADLQEMKVAALKTSHIVRDLDAIAQGHEVSLEDIDLNTIVDRFLASPEYRALVARHPGVAVILE